MMKSGRELDALVAEKVMGWTGIKPYLKSVGQHEFLTYVGWFQEDGLPKVEIPHYSTDIAEAWKVVEKFKGDRDIRIDSDFDGGYWVYPSPVFNKPIHAKTAPHAICLAALNIVNQKEIEKLSK